MGKKFRRILANVGYCAAAYGILVGTLCRVYPNGVILEFHWWHPLTAMIVGGFGLAHAALDKWAWPDVCWDCVRLRREVDELTTEHLHDR